MPRYIRTNLYLFYLFITVRTLRNCPYRAGQAGTIVNMLDYIVKIIAGLDINIATLARRLFGTAGPVRATIFHILLALWANIVSDCFNPISQGHRLNRLSLSSTLALQLNTISISSDFALALRIIAILL